jgi:hypothetical protein
MTVFLLPARAGKNKNVKKTAGKAGKIAAGTFPYLRPQGMPYVCSDINLFILKITFMSISLSTWGAIQIVASSLRTVIANPESRPGTPWIASDLAMTTEIH